ncbi:MAG: thioredoxin domain-containing protein [Chloroflexota bacterium]|nr:MAG: thioredoxin domain-containing protein [Chloroflexota bacterium]
MALAWGNESHESQETPFRFSPRPNRASEIQWHEWGKDAFKQASREDKPVLLSISAIWCHWCHVMDETSYSDPDVIATVNQDYIPIRVDADQRPDVDRRYNQGGWPSTVILTPTGEILVGATYIPPTQLSALLWEVRDYYKKNQADVLAKVAQLRARQEALLSSAMPATMDLSEDVVSNLMETVLHQYDPQYGGFGREPKFPHVDALQLALEQYCRRHEERLREVVVTSLDAMQAGGMFDHEEGGFFRYSTTRDWSVPHFEKMLEDNANLLRLYLDAFRVIDMESYRETALQVMSYLERTLRDPATGAFFGSQDALEDYYSLSGSERQIVQAPAVDATIYTDRNARVASAYFTAFAVLGDARYRDIAVGLVEFLWSQLRAPEGGMFHYYRSGEPNLLGLIGDQLRMAEALLDAYEATGQTAYLDNAAELLKLVRRDYYDTRGGFLDISEQHAAEGVAGLVRRESMIADNALAAVQFLRLNYLASDPVCREVARSALARFANDYQRYDLLASAYGQAMDRFMNEPVLVTIVGRMGEASTRDLLCAGLHAFSPWKIVQTLDPVQDAERLRQSRYQPGSVARAYVCRNRTCFPPIETAQGVESVVRACDDA